MPEDEPNPEREAPPTSPPAQAAVKPTRERQRSGVPSALQVSNQEIIVQLRHLNKQLERFNRKRRYVLLSLTGGMARGFGAALGATLIFAIAVALLTRLDSVPVVGEYVTNIIGFVKANSPASLLLPDATPTPSDFETPAPDSN